MVECRSFPGPGRAFQALDDQAPAGLAAIRVLKDSTSSVEVGTALRDTLAGTQPINS